MEETMTQLQLETLINSSVILLNEYRIDWLKQLTMKNYVLAAQSEKCWTAEYIKYESLVEKSAIEFGTHSRAYI